MTSSSSSSGTQSQRPETPFVVGLGAAAGGIDALLGFFRRVRADTRAAYVVILHLVPDSSSRLVEVLQRSTGIRVVQVQERVRIEPGRVYVVPATKMLTLDGPWLELSRMTRFEQHRSPVDFFFRSLADARGSRVACVIMSGAGASGASGLKRVKEYGGLVLAQAPDEAEYPDMPRHAIAAGMVDLVLHAGEMPARIESFQERLQQSVDESIRLSEPGEAHEIRAILTALRGRTGNDFSHYKPGTVRRRIQRRLQVRNLPSLAAYARTIEESPDEAVALLRELLGSVTNFFRDPPVFELLGQHVIPRILHQKAGLEPVRIWVPACATGEEAYSIAMLVAEHRATAPDLPTIQLFATELDEHALSVGREALYSDADVVDISEERLQRFFTRESGGYRIRRELREMILFARHNVLEDPPFSHIDLISCRNLLIYLTRPVQQRLSETFHFSLRPGGYLVLGVSEIPDNGRDLFTVFDKGAHIFQARAVATRTGAPMSGPAPVVPQHPNRHSQAQSSERIDPLDLHLRLLEQYAPPSVVVTEEHHVVHMSEHAGRYMQISGGEPTRDLLKLARPDLRPDLRMALHQAARQRAPVRIHGVSVKLEDGEHRVDIGVNRVVQKSDPMRGYLLVTFAEREPTPLLEKAREISGQSGAPAAHLEEELARIRMQLRAAIEQCEIQAEEARAVNEELQKMNQELRWSAEELQMSKEELESLNEELTTVNQELKIKLEELELTNNDFHNLISSTDIGTIFLDRELRVKLSTVAANQILDLRRMDIRRPFSEITAQLLKGGDLHDDVQQVLRELGPSERELQTRSGRWTLARIRPYRTIDDRIDGVVITFQDITERRETEVRLRQGEERLRILIDSATEYAIFTMGMEGIIDSWNSGAQRMFGHHADEIVGKSFEVLFTPEDRAGNVPAEELKRAYESGRAEEERFHMRKDGSRFYCSGVTMGLGESLGFAKIARDLSVQQQAQEALRVVQAEFESNVGERTGELDADVSARTAAHQHVSTLLQRIVTAQEDERARIARDLHDQLGQQLTALRLMLEHYRDDLVASGRVPAEVERALRLTHEIDSEVDFLAWELRPAVLDDLGLAAALPRFVHEWSSHHNIPAEYRDRGVTSGQISRDAEVVFYRIAQEALTNVVKHAHASRVDVLLESRDGTLRLVIEDDGVGFDPLHAQTRATGIGLIGMRERAATIGAELQIESVPGEGTSIFLLLRTPAGSPGRTGERG